MRSPPHRRACHLLAFGLLAYGATAHPAKRAEHGSLIQSLQRLEDKVDTALVASAPTLERGDTWTMCEFPCAGGCPIHGIKECTDENFNQHRSTDAYTAVKDAGGSESKARGIQKLLLAGKELPAPAKYFGGYDEAVLKAAQDAIDRGKLPPPGSYPPGKVKKTPVVMFIPYASQAEPAEVCALVHHGYNGGISASGRQGRYDRNTKMVAKEFAKQGVCTVRSRSLDLRDLRCSA